jgi:hypothetical protein
MQAGIEEPDNPSRKKRVPLASVSTQRMCDARRPTRGTRKTGLKIENAIFSGRSDCA